MKAAAAGAAIALVYVTLWLASRRYSKAVDAYDGAGRGDLRLFVAPCALPLYERLETLYEDWRQRRASGDCSDLLTARDRGESQAALSRKRGWARDWIRRNPARAKPLTVGIVRRLRAVR
jgi:hypothetical protein